MALIKCPECEKEISDKVKSCPHCGFPLINEDDDVQKVEVTSVKLQKMNPKKKKALIVGSIIMALAIAVILTSVFFKQNSLPKLNAEEQIALVCIEDLHNRLKNPESLQVHDIQVIEDGETDYYYIDISAQNSMGGLTRDSYIFSGSNCWSYNNDVDGKDLEKEVPVGALLGFVKYEEDKGVSLDKDKILLVFTKTK